MCKRYIAIAAPRADDTPGPQIVGEGDDLNALYSDCEGHVKTCNEAVHIYERISTGKPTAGVQWEGRRRPGQGG